jgi:hypothetical protein
MTWMSHPTTPETTRVRRGRLTLACGSLLTTVLVAASATGLLPSPGLAPGMDSMDVAQAAEPANASRLPGPWDGAGLGAAAQPGIGAARPDPTPAAEPPAGSGHGRRVVFDEGTQHVWLVWRNGNVARHYRVSGSVTDNLDAGTYEVYSRSLHATSFDLASTMKYMVRFAQGERAAIGFHSIPLDAQGRRLQTFSELGTPQSHGCIRQRPADARALWRFADLGTRVVVV